MQLYRHDARIHQDQLRSVLESITGVVESPTSRVVMPTLLVAPAVGKYTGMVQRAPDKSYVLDALLEQNDATDCYRHVQLRVPKTARPRSWWQQLTTSPPHEIATEKEWFCMMAQTHVQAALSPEAHILVTTPSPPVTYTLVGLDPHTPTIELTVSNANVPWFAFVKKLQMILHERTEAEAKTALISDESAMPTTVATTEPALQSTVAATSPSDPVAMSVMIYNIGLPDVTTAAMDLRKGAMHVAQMHGVAYVGGQSGPSGFIDEYWVNPSQLTAFQVDMFGFYQTSTLSPKLLINPSPNQMTWIHQPPQPPSVHATARHAREICLFGDDPGRDELDLQGTLVTNTPPSTTMYWCYEQFSTTRRSTGKVTKQRGGLLFMLFSLFIGIMFALQHSNLALTILSAIYSHRYLFTYAITNIVTGLDIAYNHVAPFATTAYYTVAPYVVKAAQATEHGVTVAAPYIVKAANATGEGVVSAYNTVAPIVTNAATATKHGIVTAYETAAPVVAAAAKATASATKRHTVSLKRGL